MISSDASPAWLLPAGFEDLGPCQASALEHLRRELLDLYVVWGYRQVIPPMLEHLESLLTGSAADLDLQTWKVLDQASGRLLGFRSDMTPQMARMDAQMSRDHELRRLCYAGTVLRAQPDALGGSRAPFQVGAELFGVAGPEGDLEILSLMAETLMRCQDAPLLLDLGHVAISLALVEATGLAGSRRAALLRHLERKAWADVRQLLLEAGVAAGIRDDFALLAHLRGERQILDVARKGLGQYPAIRKATDTLEAVWEAFSGRYPQIDVACDLAELQGHRYHTGLLFAIYGPQRGNALAQGGRYDGIGEVFGQSRPATGFSIDLRPLLKETGGNHPDFRVWAPPGQDAELWKSICDLRTRGYTVVQELRSELRDQPDQSLPTGYDAALQHDGGGWKLWKPDPDGTSFPSL